MVSIPAVVVLPAPFGPSRPKISPASMLRSSPSTALKSVFGYCLVSPAVRMIAAPASPFSVVTAWKNHQIMDLGLRDRACIVTGASGGIGRATAVAFAREGAAVLLLGRRQEALAEVARGVRGGRRAGGETLALDVTAADAGERAVQACLERFGRIDALVNGAGTSAVRPHDELTDDEWQSQWELHVMAPMRLMRAAAPEWLRGGWGRIVNVCSSSGKRPSSTNMAYSVTKAAELSLSRAFADTLRLARGSRELRLAGADRRGPVAVAGRPRRPERSVPRRHRARTCSRRSRPASRSGGSALKRRSRR